MSKSRKKKIHPLEKMTQMDLVNSIRKVSTKNLATRVINPKDANKERKFDWRDAADSIDSESEDDFSDIEDTY